MYSRPSLRRALVFTPRSTFSQSKSQAFKLFRSASTLCSHRTLITGSFRTGGAPVDLRYDVLHPNHGSKTERPLVILHGLFGMKRNWLSLSKAFHRELQRPVYALDLRNHGSSPHARPMNYEAMANDVIHFFRSQSLSNVSLLGHSMGGKVAMAVALSSELPANAVEDLIVADIAPSNGALSAEFQGYVEGMNKIEQSKVNSRREAQDILASYEPDSVTRAFLLTNLDTTVQPFKFQVPLDIIGSSIPDIGSFPYQPGERSWDGKALFVKGTKSKYINKHNIPIAKEFFPSMTLETVDAGHWVHAEKPNEFKKLVVDFITRT